MFGCGPYLRGSRSSLALLAGVAFIPATALAQDPPPPPEQVTTTLQRLQALEQSIQARQAELDGYRTELEALRRQLAPPAPPPPDPLSPQVALNDHGICNMANASDVNQALLNPGALSGCIRPAGTIRPAISRAPAEGPADLTANVSVSSPDRPRIAPGISTTLEFANSGRASITYTHPIIYRSVRYRRGAGVTRDDEIDDRRNEFLGFRPQLLTISGGLSVPITKGESNFLSVTRRAERADADVLSGTTLRLGVDFLNFESYNDDQSTVRLARFLWRARQACATARSVPLNRQNLWDEEERFFAFYDLERNKTDGPRRDRWQRATARNPNPIRADEDCIGPGLINFVLETDHDGQGGSRFTNAALAAEYQAIFWEEPRAAIPRWGLGASVEYGTTDFTYRQGSLLIGPTGDPPSTTLNLNRTQPLADPRTDTEDDWKVQIYGAFFLPTRHARRPPIRGVYTPGVMLVASAAYLSAHQFRTGASEVSYCPLPGPNNPNDVSIACSAINIDRPYMRDGFTLSGELRTQFNNVPVLGVFGLAPRYSRRLGDGRQTLDLPIYLSPNDKGWGSAGIRFRRQWDGTDLLGNEEVTTSEISIFVSSAINFRGY